MMSRIRLLPILIFCAAFTLSLKLGTLWQGVDKVVMSSAAVAQEKTADTASKKEPAEEKKEKEKKAVAGESEDTENSGKSEDSKTAVRFDPRLVTDSELDVLQKLAERRIELDRRSRGIDTREKLLRATENRIEAKIADLKEIQETIKKLLVKHDKEKEQKMRSVVKIYEKMKPKDAARIFEEMEMPILLDVVERMREAKTAPILANMTPQKAKRVTAALAQRRALPKLDQAKIN
jgi:flagellar motility protein MotE (MotC chaperone)